MKEKSPEKKDERKNFCVSFLVVSCLGFSVFVSLGFFILFFLRLRRFPLPSNNASSAYEQIIKAPQEKDAL